MDVPFRELRRIQFDIERGRHATLVIVPESFKYEPRVFSVPNANLTETAVALALVGKRINEAASEQTG